MNIKQIEAVKLAMTNSAQEHPFFFVGLPNWITDGRFAVRVDDPAEYGAMSKGDNPSSEKYLKDIIATKDAVPLTELPLLSLPPVAEVPEQREGDVKCDACNGKGEHECSCGNLHDCEECDGEGFEPGKVIVEWKSGKMGRVAFAGTRAGATAPGLPVEFKVCIQGWYQKLLEGMTVKGTGSVEPVIGCDPKTGEALALVMPYRDTEVF